MIRNSSWSIDCGTEKNDAQATDHLMILQLSEGIIYKDTSSRKMLKLIQPISKKDQVIAAIKDAILSGAIEPGDQIVESRMAHELGSGIPLVREALVALEHQGFVQKTPYKGTTVTKLEPKQIQDNFQLRVELEPLAVEWASGNVTPADIRELRDLIRRMERAAADLDLDQFYQNDLEWHRKLWDLSGNAYLADTLERLVVPLFAFFVMKTSREKEAYVESAATHARIVEALAESSAAEARALMKESLSGWKDDMMTLLFAKPDPDNPMSTAIKNRLFEYVQDLWRDEEVEQLSGVDRLVYRSNKLGEDLTLTNTGGGNTSSKLTETDPLTGQPVEVLWLKGSGGDLRTAKRDGFASLYLDKVRAMKPRYLASPERGPKTPIEDEMYPMYSHCVFNLNPRACSIDTPLHTFVPFKHVDHLHPNAVIAIAASVNQEKLTKEIYGDEVIYIPWQRPGFDIGLKIEQLIKDNPRARGILLGHHGMSSWNDDDRTATKRRWRSSIARRVTSKRTTKANKPSAGRSISR